MKYLDHRGRVGTVLFDAGLARFQTKWEAGQFAKEHGWFAKDATRAANRFSSYWVVGQCIGPETFRYLSTSGTIIEDNFPGFW